MPTPKPSELIGTTAAAAQLGISPSTLTRRAERGDPEPVGKLSGRNGALIFRRADIDAHAERNLCDRVEAVQ